ncbi:MAG: hypothetical protein Q4B70_09300 [Lachnospiraceae bacterium]|nr:hypothetical protein [Lachnospiraceae bacterium]
MDKEYYDALVKLRLDSAEELLADAESLLEKGFYKSANEYQMISRADQIRNASDYDDFYMLKQCV